MLLDEIFDLYTTYITLVMFSVIFFAKIAASKTINLKKQRKKKDTRRVKEHNVSNAY